PGTGAARARRRLPAGETACVPRGRRPRLPRRAERRDRGGVGRQGCRSPSGGRRLARAGTPTARRGRRTPGRPPQCRSRRRSGRPATNPGRTLNHPDDPFVRRAAMARSVALRKAARQPPAHTAGDGDDLLARYRDGDPNAFQELFQAYGEKLVQFFYRLCWDRDRAEDFTQDLFLRLLRRASAYRPEGRLSTFIFRVATNLWIDHYRSTRPHPRLYSLDQPMLDASPAAFTPPRDRGPDPVDSAIGDEEKERLRRALEA